MLCLVGCQSLTYTYTRYGHSPPIVYCCEYIYRNVHMFTHAMMAQKNEIRMKTNIRTKYIQHTYLIRTQTRLDSARPGPANLTQAQLVRYVKQGDDYFEQIYQKKFFARLLIFFLSDCHTYNLLIHSGDAAASSHLYLIKLFVYFANAQNVYEY